MICEIQRALRFLIRVVRAASDGGSQVRFRDRQTRWSILTVPERT